jgi:peptide deformylase
VKLPKGKVRDIRIYGDPVLRRKADRVEKIDPALLALAADLVATMLARDGVGLAANQIGDRHAVVALNPKGADVQQDVLVLVNPEVVECSGTAEREEACLSLPGISEVLARPARVKVRAVGLDGKALEVTGEGTLARALLHETDHLNAVLFIDHLPLVRRRMLKGRLEELSTSRKGKP